MKTLAEKIAVMQAALDGKKVEIQDEGKWVAISYHDPVFNWGVTDYRIAEAPIVAPEGFELVPTDSKEVATRGWMMKHKTDPQWFYVTATHCHTVSEDVPGYFYARPIAKREPRMPDVPVFLVSNQEFGYSCFVPCVITNLGISIYRAGRVEWLELSVLLNCWQWSADRKTWFNFYGEQVP